MLPMPEIFRAPPEQIFYKAGDYPIPNGKSWIRLWLWLAMTLCYFTDKTKDWLQW